MDIHPADALVTRLSRFLFSIGIITLLPQQSKQYYFFITKARKGENTKRNSKCPFRSFFLSCFRDKEDLSFRLGVYLCYNASG